MAKSTNSTIKKTETKTIKVHPKTALKDGRMRSKDSGGVVAYTKGSRFNDAEVLAVVERVLSKS